MKVLYFDEIKREGFDVNLSREGIVLYKAYKRLSDDTEVDSTLYTPYLEGRYHKSHRVCIKRHDPVLIKVVEELGYNSFIRMDSYPGAKEVLSSEDDFHYIITEVPSSGYMIASYGGDWKGDERLITVKTLIRS